METQASLVAAQIAADGIEQDLVLISGTIGLDGLQLAPVQAMRAVATTGGGEYTLRLVTRDGRMFEHAFDAELVDHAVPPERQFAVAVPDPGTAIARIEVLRGSTPVPARSSGLATAQRAVGPSIERLRGVDWSESNGRLRVQWDTAAASHVAVTYVAYGVRTVLGVNRIGGNGRDSTSASLPRGRSLRDRSDRRPERPHGAGTSLTAWRPGWCPGLQGLVAVNSRGCRRAAARLPDAAAPSSARRSRRAARPCRCRRHA